MFEKVLSCYKWVGTGGVYQRDRGELSEGLERLVRLEHLAVLKTPIIKTKFGREIDFTS